MKNQVMRIFKENDLSEMWLQSHIMQNHSQLLSDSMEKNDLNYRVSQKKFKRFTDHRTKGFCLIIKFSFDFKRKRSNLDFETTFAQFRFELIEIHQFQNCQVGFHFQDFATFVVLIFTMHVHWIICNNEEISAEYKLKWPHAVYF